MSVEDKRMARDLTRELFRRQHLDLSETRISVMRGIGYIGGVIKPSLGETVEPKAETKAIIDAGKRVPGLRDIVVDARYDTSSKR